MKTLTFKSGSLAVSSLVLSFALVSAASAATDPAPNGSRTNAGFGVTNRATSSIQITLPQAAARGATTSMNAAAGNNATVTVNRVATTSATSIMASSTATTTLASSAIMQEFLNLLSRLALVLQQLAAVGI